MQRGADDREWVDLPRNFRLQLSWLARAARDAKAFARRLALPRQVCLPVAPAANCVPTCVNSTWPSPATCTTSPQLLSAPCAPPRVLADAVHQPRGGDGPLLPAPAWSPGCQAAPNLPPRAPVLPAWLHSSIYTANSWHMPPGKEDSVGGLGAAAGPGFGKGREAGGESRGWERHRHQSAGSKQSWRRETTTSCQALLKTRRAQKGKGRKTKGLGGEGRRRWSLSAEDDELQVSWKLGATPQPAAPGTRWGCVVCLRRGYNSRVDFTHRRRVKQAAAAISIQLHWLTGPARVCSGLERGGWWGEPRSAGRLNGRGGGRVLGDRATSDLWGLKRRKE